MVMRVAGRAWLSKTTTSSLDEFREESRIGSQKRIVTQAFELVGRGGVRNFVSLYMMNAGISNKPTMALIFVSVSPSITGTTAVAAQMLSL